MKCLFISKDSIYGNTVILKNKDVHHLRAVFRIKIDEELELKDSDFAYHCSLAAATRYTLTFTIRHRRPLLTPKLNITLCQALIKNNAFDFLLQKTTELGLSKIVPFVADFSVVKLKQVYKNKLTRWQAICEEAAKQSGSDFIPVVYPVLSCLSDISTLPKQRLFAINQHPAPTLKQQLVHINPNDEIVIIIGPEGGFSNREIQLAQTLNSLSCSLNIHLLRSETAAISAISNLFFHYGY